MAAAALVILALAEPVLNPNRETALKGTGPVVIVVDNGWASAARFAERTRFVDRLIAEAEGQSRPGARRANGGTRQDADAAHRGAKRGALDGSRAAAAAFRAGPQAKRRSSSSALSTACPQASIVWLADGIDHDGAARAFADKLVSLAGSGSVVVVESKPGEEAIAAAAGLGRDGRLEATVAARRRRAAQRRSACLLRSWSEARRSDVRPRSRLTQRRWHASISRWSSEIR